MATVCTQISLCDTPVSVGSQPWRKPALHAALPLPGPGWRSDWWPDAMGFVPMQAWCLRLLASLSPGCRPDGPICSAVTLQCSAAMVSECCSSRVRHVRSTDAASYDVARLPSQLLRHAHICPIGPFFRQLQPLPGSGKREVIIHRTLAEYSVLLYMDRRH